MNKCFLVVLCGVFGKRTLKLRLLLDDEFEEKETCNEDSDGVAGEEQLEKLVSVMLMVDGEEHEISLVCTIFLQTY